MQSTVFALNDAAKRLIPQHEHGRTRRLGHIFRCTTNCRTRRELGVSLRCE